MNIKKWVAIMKLQEHNETCSAYHYHSILEKEFEDSSKLLSISKFSPIRWLDKANLPYTCALYNGIKNKKNVCRITLMKLDYFANSENEFDTKLIRIIKKYISDELYKTRVKKYLAQMNLDILTIFSKVHSSPDVGLLVDLKERANLYGAFGGTISNEFDELLIYDNKVLSVKINSSSRSGSSKNGKEYHITEIKDLDTKEKIENQWNDAFTSLKRSTEDVYTIERMKDSLIQTYDLSGVIEFYNSGYFRYPFNQMINDEIIFPSQEQKKSNTTGFEPDISKFN